MKFTYSKLKDFKLRQQRGISFGEIIDLAETGCLLEIIPHYDPIKYSQQKIMVLNIKDYIWLVPFEQKDDILHLKTAFRSRKYTKIYLGKSNE